MDCSLPGSFAHGILQARILEWVAVPFSRESSQPRNRTQVSCIAGRFFTSWVTWEAQGSHLRWNYSPFWEVGATEGYNSFAFAVLWILEVRSSGTIPSASYLGFQKIAKGFVLSPHILTPFLTSLSYSLQTNHGVLKKGAETYKRAIAGPKKIGSLAIF